VGKKGVGIGSEGRAAGMMRYMERNHINFGLSLFNDVCERKEVGCFLHEKWYFINLAYPFWYVMDDERQ